MTDKPLPPLLIQPAPEPLRCHPFLLAIVRSLDAEGKHAVSQACSPLWSAAMTRLGEAEQRAEKAEAELAEARRRAAEWQADAAQKAVERDAARVQRDEARTIANRSADELAAISGLLADLGDVTTDEVEGVREVIGKLRTFREMAETRGARMVTLMTERDEARRNFEECRVAIRDTDANPPRCGVTTLAERTQRAIDSLAAKTEARGFGPYDGGGERRCVPVAESSDPFSTSVARVIRAMADWTPEARAMLAREMRERWPKSVGNGEVGALRLRVKALSEQFATARQEGRKEGWQCGAEAMRNRIVNYTSPRLAEFTAPYQPAATGEVKP